jgi:hypothetical protein
MKQSKLVASIFALGLATALSACSEPETTTDEVVVVEPAMTEDPMMATMEADTAAMEADTAAMEADTAAMESDAMAMESEMQADMIANDGEMPAEMMMEEEAPAEMN